MVEIQIDATRLFYRFFIIPEKAPSFVDARSIQQLQLEPETYHYQTQSGVFADFTFQVTAQGTVDYARAFDAFLSGRGTTTPNDVFHTLARRG